MSNDDHLTRRGAELLASRIAKYWSKRRFTVDAFAEPLPQFPGQWQVRSDLVNGMPANVKSSHALYRLAV